jgi:hypothetical protein
MKYTLYLDMDGVLCDFDKAYRALDHDKVDRLMFRYATMELRIFETLDPMPDARILLNYVSRIPDVTCEILTSMGTYDPVQGNAAMMQKMNWLRSHNIPYKPNFVRSKIEKANYANPNTILIDDSPGCVNPFNSAGGNAILHKTAPDTIAQLEKLLSGLRGLEALRA